MDILETAFGPLQPDQHKLMSCRSEVERLSAAVDTIDFFLLGWSFGWLRGFCLCRLAFFETKSQASAVGTI